MYISNKTPVRYCSIVQIRTGVFTYSVLLLNLYLFYIRSKATCLCHLPLRAWYCICHASVQRVLAKVCSGQAFPVTVLRMPCLRILCAAFQLL